MEIYTLNGIMLYVPDAILTPAIRRMLEKGWYEVEELRALKAHLRKTDTVLELGSGIGYLASVCAQTVGAKNVTTVEANPDLLAVIEQNLSENGAQDATLLHGVVVGASISGNTEFHLSDAFWSATHKDRSGPSRKKISVPSLTFDWLVETCQPSVLIADVEGAEEDFFQSVLPQTLRLIILELHPQYYPPKAIRCLFQRLFDQNFAYHTKGSNGSVVVFERDAA